MEATTSAAAERTPRVLSIQSHVVHGYVGNKCAVFPLQLHGMEVDPVYSVQFSNHTGYPSFTGAVYDGAALSTLVQGLKDNGLLNHTHLLTGYIGSVSLLHAIADLAAELRARAPGGTFTYLCDPVMGDEGRLYVAAEMVDAFRERLVPLASVMVPNSYEATLLTGVDVCSVEDALRACDALHARGPHTVVVTSLALADEPGSIQLVASTTQPQAGGAAAQRLAITIPRIPAYFTGTGDLLAALLLAWMRRHPDDLTAAIEAAVGGLQAVLTDTARNCGPAALAGERTSQVCEARELRLVANQAALLSPPITLRARQLGGAGPPS